MAVVTVATIVTRSWSTLCVLFHKARCSVRCCSLYNLHYTADLAAVGQKHNVTVHAFADDSHRCICTAVATTLRRQLIVSNAASNECLLIVSSSIRTRPSCCGSERGTVCLNMALFLCCNSVLAESHRLTTSVFLELRLRRILTSIDTSLSSAHHVSTGYDNIRKKCH